MEVVIFHLKGKMGHFRRYYSNSSALTYTIPPRTTLAGIMAGLLGYERDTYYEDFSLEQCHIAVASCQPLKKIMQKLNLLMIKSANDLNGSKEHHSQTATELLIPQDICNGYIDYKVWFSHNNPEIMNKLKKLIGNNDGSYLSKGIALALGSAQNLGWIEFENTCNGIFIDEESCISIDSVIPTNKIGELSLTDITNYTLIKEEVPLEFDVERKMTSKGKNHMLINLEPQAIVAKVSDYIKLDNGENITWME